jgi:hypothetical protein
MEHDKTYMWLAIIAFVALVVASGFALIELNELKAGSQAQAARSSE